MMPFNWQVPPPPPAGQHLHYYPQQQQQQHLYHQQQQQHYPQLQQQQPPPPPEYFWNPATANANNNGISNNNGDFPRRGVRDEYKINYNQHPPVMSSTPKLLQAARQGFTQFRRDFGTDPPEEAGRGPPENNVREYPPLVGGVRGFSPPAACFGVEDELFEDGRAVINFVNLEGPHQRQKEFRLFEAEDWMSEMIRKVYNVNYMDPMVPWEISSKRMFPRSVEKWPVDVHHCSEFNELRNVMLMLSGPGENMKKSKLSDTTTDKPESAAGSSGSSDNSSIDAYGLKSLARFLDGEGVQDNPMGFLTFAGMNLNKLMKDLDKKEPMTSTFAGPFAEHNFSLDFTGIGVTRSFEEYDVPDRLEFDFEEDSLVSRSSTVARLSRSTLSHFSFEILIFIFYTFYGDALQLLAAEELYKRGWRFHKTFQVWLAPWKILSDGRGYSQYSPTLQGKYEPSKEPIQESEMEMWYSGCYIYFHYGKWDFEVQEFRFHEGILEGKPVEFEEALWD